MSLQLLGHHDIVNGESYNPIQRGSNMDLMSLAGGIGAGINSLSNLIFGASDRKYARDLQQQLFARDDTAYQRTMADLEAAGVNPLMAISGGFSQSGNTKGFEPNPIDLGFDKVGDSLQNAYQFKKQYDRQQTIDNENLEILKEQKKQLKLDTQIKKMQKDFAEKNNGFLPGQSHETPFNTVLRQFFSSPGFQEMVQDSGDITTYLYHLLKNKVSDGANQLPGIIEDVASSVKKDKYTEYLENNPKITQSLKDPNKYWLYGYKFEGKPVNESYIYRIADGKYELHLIDGKKKEKVVKFSNLTPGGINALEFELEYHKYK